MNVLNPAERIISSYCNVKEKLGQFCQKQTELTKTDHKSKTRGSGKMVGFRFMQLLSLLRTEVFTDLGERNKTASLTR